MLFFGGFFSMQIHEGQITLAIMFGNKQEEYTLYPRTSSKAISLRMKELVAHLQANYIITTKEYDCLLYGTGIELTMKL